MRSLKIILFITVLVLPSLTVIGQNYIGLHKDDIKDKVRKELSGFHFSNEVFNNDRSFVKYENAFEEQTIIFMLNSKGYCISVLRMYNTWLFNRIKLELEEKFGKSKNLKWNEMKEGQKYEIELIRGEWFITVVTRKR
jgi:hypothetical protein